MIRDSRLSSPGATQKASSLMPLFLSASISASKRGDMLGTPVVGEMLEPEPLEHGRAVFGAAVLAVERNDAPGDQVFASEQPLGAIRRSGLWSARAAADRAMLVRLGRRARRRRERSVKQ